MSRYSGIRQGIERIADRTAQRKSGAVDELVKMAQLKELGYDVQPGKGGLFGGGPTITQDPNFISTKSLERQKLQNQLDPNYAANQAAAKERALFGVRKEMFGDLMGGQASGQPGGAGVGGGQFIMTPDGRIRNNPNYFNEGKERKKQQIKREFELSKPLSGEAAGKLAGAEQGLGNTRDIRNTLGLKKDQFGNVTANKDFRGQLFGARAANFNLPIPGIGGVVNTAVQAFAGDDARKLDLYYQTLAENNLRARTGAAATEPEIRREKARLMGRVFENPAVIEERLAQSDQFLGGTAENIRPGSTAGFGQPEQVPQVPDWAVGEESFYVLAKDNGWDDESILEHIRSRRS